MTSGTRHKSQHDYYSSKTMKTVAGDCWHFRKPTRAAQCDIRNIGRHIQSSPARRPIWCPVPAANWENGPVRQTIESGSDYGTFACGYHSVWRKNSVQNAAVIIALTQLAGCVIWVDRCNQSQLSSQAWRGDVLYKLPHARVDLEEGAGALHHNGQKAAILPACPHRWVQFSP